MTYSPDKIRNIAVVGHQGSGKTTLIESIAFKSGLTNKKGTVEDGNTLSDYLADERRSSVLSPVLSSQSPTRITNSI